MKTIKVCYSERDNIGDSINPFILRDVLGVKFKNVDKYSCDITGIGSGLRRFFYNPDETTLPRKAIKSLFSQIYYKPVILWSAGFLSTPKGKQSLTRKNIVPACVRGELSKSYVGKITGINMDSCVTGDAGLLVSELVPSNSEKRFKLGIIPHDKERDEVEYNAIHNNIPDSTIIDVRGDVIQRLKAISECECIISSSLHGLIIADSFSIPNRRVVLTNKLSGDGFKFDDYYSAFSVEHKPIDLRGGLDLDVRSIISGYKISFDAVEEKKAKIKEAFFKYIDD